MRLVENVDANGTRGGACAGSIMGDLQRVGAPEELSDLAQQTSTRLAVPSGKSQRLRSTSDR